MTGHFNQAAGVTANGSAPGAAWRGVEAIAVVFRNPWDLRQIPAMLDKEPIAGG